MVFLLFWGKDEYNKTSFRNCSFIAENKFWNGRTETFTSLERSPEQ